MAIPRLLLLRHGQSTWNAERRWQGWADAPLTELGEQQALDAADHVGSLGLTRVCCSDLQRARRTADLLADSLGLGEVVSVPAIRERNAGLFTGLTMEVILQRWPECFEPETNRLLSVPEGESDEDLWDRAVPALLRLGSRFAGERLLVVGHGGVIRAIERRLGIALGPATPNLSGRWFAVDDGQLAAGDAVLSVEPELSTTPKSE